jgi:hypothetical protein
MVIMETSMLGRFLIWIGVAKPPPKRKVFRQVKNYPWKETYYR